MASAKRCIVTGLFAVALAGCAVGADPWIDDAGPVADATPGIDAHDVQMPRDAAPIDAPRDTPRTDTSTGVDHVDVSQPRDTGPAAMCPSSCSYDTECGSLCPAAGAGYVNCCLTSAGGGSCYQAMGSVCPTGGTDAGTMGAPDTGVIPLPGGGPGAACSADSQCNSGSTCCVIIFGGVGVCGCAVPIFRCLPASGGTC